LLMGCRISGYPRRKQDSTVFNGNGKGGRSRHKAGYVVVRRPKHPRAKGSLYVFDHILVMDELLGRYLLPEETVQSSQRRQG
jgi:hypothetical protein